MREFLEATAWQPRRMIFFAGAVRYTRYGLLKRLMTKVVVRRSGGSELDVGRHYEDTDWDAVERLVDNVLALVQDRGAA